MKKSEIPIEILNAGPCLIGEYRGTKVERIDFVDKKDGKAKGFIKATHLVEVGLGGAVSAVRVDEKIPENITDPAQVKVPYKRGGFYLFRLASLTNDKGNLEGRLVAGSAVVELN
jgi:hypothetical protein